MSLSTEVKKKLSEKYQLDDKYLLVFETMLQIQKMTMILFNDKLHFMLPNGQLVELSKANEDLVDKLFLYDLGIKYRIFSSNSISIKK